MDLTSKISLKQQLVRQKLCHSYSHQVAISISSCVAVTDSENEDNNDVLQGQSLTSTSTSTSTTKNWFDHMWCAAPTKNIRMSSDKGSKESISHNITENEDDSSNKERDLQKEINESESKIEEVIKTGIKENLLVLLEMQLLSVTADPLRSHLIPVLQCLIGRLYDRLGDYENAIKYYSMGKFVKSRRVMRCLAAKYNTMIAESRSVNALLDVSKFLHWSQSMSVAVGLMAFRLLAEELLEEDSSFYPGMLYGAGPGSHTNTSTHRPSPQQSPINNSSNNDPSLKLNFTGLQLANTVASSVLNNMIICDSNRGIQAVSLSIELLNDLKDLLHSEFGTDKDLMKSLSEEHATSTSTSAISLLSPLNTSSFSTYFSKPVSPLPSTSMSQSWYSFSPATKISTTTSTSTSTSKPSSDDKSPKSNTDNSTDNGKVEKSVAESGLMAGFIGNNIISNYIDGVTDNKYITPSNGMQNTSIITDDKGKSKGTINHCTSHEKQSSNPGSINDNIRTPPKGKTDNITVSQGPQSTHDVGHDRGQGINTNTNTSTNTSTNNKQRSRTSSEIFDAPNTPLYGLKVRYYQHIIITLLYYCSCEERKILLCEVNRREGKEVENRRY